MSLSDEETRQLDAILGHYPDRRAAAATAMRVVQARRRMEGAPTVPAFQPSIWPWSTRPLFASTSSFRR